MEAFLTSLTVQEVEEKGQNAKWQHAAREKFADYDSFFCRLSLISGFSGALVEIWAKESIVKFVLHL